MSILTWILGIVALIVLLFLWQRSASKRRLLRVVHNGIKAFKMALYYRTAYALSRTNTFSRAGLLAAAVVNRLFGEDAAGDVPRRFADENVEEIDRTTSEIMHNAEVRSLFTEAIRCEEVTRYAVGSEPRIDHFQDLIERGWIDGSEESNPPDPYQFHERALVFLGESEDMMNEVLEQDKSDG